MANRILRFIDLKEMGVVNNRPTLYRWIKDLGFPQGFLLGPNSRAWLEKEVEDWLETRHEGGAWQNDGNLPPPIQSERIPDAQHQIARRCWVATGENPDVFRRAKLSSKQ